MDIDYDYYRIFYYVAKCGSITQAAKRLLHDQPNLTRMIKLLEGELGCALFYRTNRGVRLTPEGERLYVHVKAAFEQIEAGERELAARRNLEQGEVAIAASMVALRCVLLPVLRTFRERYPGVRIHVENSTAPQAIAAIREGSADLAVVTAPARVPESLIAVPLRKIRDVAVCGSVFPELTGRRVSLKELTSFPLIALDAQTKTFETYSQFYMENGLMYQPDVEAANADQLLPMAEANLGVCFLPEPFARESSRVFTIDLEEELPVRRICLLRRANQPISVAAAAIEKLICPNPD